MGSDYLLCICRIFLRIDILTMKIIADDNIPFLRGRLEGIADVTYVDQFDFDRDTVRDADALLIRTRTRCDSRLLEGSKVRMVATATIGTDQIDIPWCESHGIEVYSSPGCNAPGVAQYVWSALLRLGFDPAAGERLGVVGCGNIGSIVKAWARHLGAEVWVSDPPKERAGIPDNYHPLEDILRECRAVTFHTPLVSEGPDATFHLAGKKELELLDGSSILVNASRGPVVDNRALLERLRRGNAPRTAIDVWENEPALDKELLSLVDYGTFHIAGYSLEGKQRATRMILEAVEKTFGVEVDKSGLEPAFCLGDAPLPSAARILDSYDPGVDSEALKMAPDDFDILRRNYNYRHETQALALR